MNGKGPFLVSGVLIIVLVALFSIWLLRRPLVLPASGISCYLVGYTNSSGANKAVFLVTNRTTTGFTYYVGSHARSVARSNGVPLLRFLGFGVTPGTLPARGAFTFAIEPHQTQTFGKCQFCSRSWTFPARTGNERQSAFCSPLASTLSTKNGITSPVHHLEGQAMT